MIGYTSLGTANLSRAESFYDALLAEFGAKQVMRMDDFIVWAAEDGGATFSIHVPENGKEYSVGNGVMIALATSDQTQVKLVHEKALKLGGVDEGKPGFRPTAFTPPISAIWTATNSMSTAWLVEPCRWNPTRS